MCTSDEGRKWCKYYQDVLYSALCEIIPRVPRGGRRLRCAICGRKSTSHGQGRGPATGVRQAKSWCADEHTAHSCPLLLLFFLITTVSRWIMLYYPITDSVFREKSPSYPSLLVNRSGIFYFPREGWAWGGGRCWVGGRVFGSNVTGRLCLFTRVFELLM